MRVEYWAVTLALVSWTELTVFIRHHTDLCMLKIVVLSIITAAWHLTGHFTPSSAQTRTRPHYSPMTHTNELSILKLYFWNFLVLHHCILYLIKTVESFWIQILPQPFCQNGQYNNASFSGLTKMKRLRLGQICKPQLIPSLPGDDLTNYLLSSLCVSVRWLTASALQMVLATWRQSVRSQELLTVSSPVSWKLNNKFSCSVGGRTTKANAFTHSEGRKREIERCVDSGQSERGENNEQ